MGTRVVRIGLFVWLLAVCLGGAGSGGFVAPGYAQGAVGRIVVEGNQRVEPSTIGSYMAISAGDLFHPEKVDQSLKNLFQTGLFADVRIFRRGSDLIVQVEENPLINKVTFEGNRELNDDKLQKEIELRARMVYTRARVQSDVQRLITIYRRSGRFAVRVEPKIIRLPQNRVNVVFEITEGVATRVETINFVGNQAFSDGALRSVISTQESAWWKILTTSDNYDPDRLNYDRELLRRHYLKHGFADFRVQSATAELAPDGASFYITFTIEEGEAYALGKVEVNPGQTSLDVERLRAALTTTTGETYDASAVDKSIENLSIKAGESGFAFAQVKPSLERDPQNRVIHLTYQIDEGPRVYIERIEIVGNSRTQDDVIRREMRLAEGDAYNRALVDRARRRITALDYFGKVDIREQPGSTPDRVVLIVECEEKSTGELSFAAGYSTVEQIIGNVSVSERNLLGRGQTVRLAVAASFKRQQVDFSFTEPYFLDRRLQFGVDAFAVNTDQEDESSFTTRQAGGGFRFGFPMSDNSSLVTRYLFVARDLDVNTDATPPPSTAILLSEGKSISSLAGLIYTYDTLDSSLNPTTGVRLSVHSDVAGLGGDAHFARTEATAHYFRPVGWDSVIFMAKGTAGHMEPLFGDSISPLDRFYKGGESFRGFARGGVGPRDVTPGGRKDAIGGLSYAIGTLEVSFPLGLPEELGVRGAVFSDFGTVFDASALPSGVPATTVIADDAAFRASVGGSILWKSPLGPLRFDLAYPIAKADYDKTEWFRFGIGTKF